MNNPAGQSPAPLPALERDVSTPLHRQIYLRFRTAIEQGVLKPGERVASARSLASALNVARGTVEAAYGQLAGEGYLIARGPAGTVVSPALPARLVEPRRAAAGHVERGAAPAAPDVARMPPLLPLQLGVPAFDAFPRKLWARLAARRIRAIGVSDMDYGDPAGHLPLREAIAAYLGVSRGVPCSAAQVFVTGGYRASLALAARVLLEPGAQVWVEDPGFPPTGGVLGDAGMRPVAVPVDAEGLRVDLGRHRAAAARMAVITPSHQAPLGVSMSLPRRLQLLDWASRARAWIVEDDYDGEYHYASAPLPALKSLDGHDRVLYAGSFSKSLYPGLALGYLVVPQRQCQAFDAALRAGSNGCPQLMQAIVADFMHEGHFARHLRKMRLLYARRRAFLEQALQQAFGDAVAVALQGGGMHLIARFPGAQEGDAALARRAQAAGLNAQALSERCASAREQGLLMGFTNIASQVQARRVVKRLQAALAL